MPTLVSCAVWREASGHGVDGTADIERLHTGRAPTGFPLSAFKKLTHAGSSLLNSLRINELTGLKRRAEIYVWKRSILNYMPVVESKSNLHPQRDQLLSTLA